MGEEEVGGGSSPKPQKQTRNIHQNAINLDSTTQKISDRWCHLLYHTYISFHSLYGQNILLKLMNSIYILILKVHGWTIK